MVTSGVVTTTSPVPAGEGAVRAVIVVAFTTVTLVAATPLIVTAVAPVKPVPVMVTLVKPEMGPACGEMLVTAGGASYVNRLEPVPVAMAVVTETSPVPAVPTPVVAVIVVAFTTVTPVAETPLIVTLVAPVKLVPVMVTDVPPDVEPELGEMLVTVGAAA